MRSVSMLEFRKDAEKIIRNVQRGQSVMLLYRGKPAIRLEPVHEEIQEADAFYSLTKLATDGESLTDREIDRTLYGS